MGDVGQSIDMSKNRRLVLVEWRDACKYPPGWTPTDELADASPENGHSRPEPCRSVGWVLLNDRTGISLCPTFSGADDDFGQGGVFIPRGCVVRVRTLKAEGR